MIKYKPPHRFQFRISALMVVLTMTGVVMSFVSNRLRQREKQIAGIEYFTHNGFSVEYEHYPDIAEMTPPLSGTYCRNVEELLGVPRLFGKDFTWRITALRYDGGAKGEVDWTKLRSFPHLRILFAGSCEQWNEAAVAEVAKLNDIAIVHVSSTSLDDIAVELLSHAKRLCDLDISNTQVTDESVGSLSQMRNLTSLDLHGTRVSKKGLENLRIRLNGCDIFY